MADAPTAAALSRSSVWLARSTAPPSTARPPPSSAEFFSTRQSCSSSSPPSTSAAPPRRARFDENSQRRATILPRERRRAPAGRPAKDELISSTSPSSTCSARSKAFSSEGRKLHSVRVMATAELLTRSWPRMVSRMRWICTKAAASDEGRSPASGPSRKAKSELLGSATTSSVVPSPSSHSSLAAGSTAANGSMRWVPRICRRTISPAVRHAASSAFVRLPSGLTSTISVGGGGDGGAKGGGNGGASSPRR